MAVIYVASEQLAKVRLFLILPPIPKFKLVSVFLAPSFKSKSFRIRSRSRHIPWPSSEKLPEPQSAHSTPPFPASRSELISYHDPSYIDALLADPPGLDPPSRKEFGLEDVIAAPVLSAAPVLTFGTQDCPPFPGLSEYVLAVAGASLTAARELAEGRCDIAICWDGGRSLQSLTSSRLSAECPQTPRS